MFSFKRSHGISWISRVKRLGRGRRLSHSMSAEAEAVAENQGLLCWLELSVVRCSRSWWMNPKKPYRGLPACLGNWDCLELRRFLMSNSAWQNIGGRPESSRNASPMPSNNFEISISRADLNLILSLVEKCPENPVRASLPRDFPTDSSWLEPPHSSRAQRQLKKRQFRAQESRASALSYWKIFMSRRGN